MATQEVVSAVQRLGYVAIDFGNTATRAVAAVHKIDRATKRQLTVNPKICPIEDTQACDDAGKRFQGGEFPSRGCPFDGPPFLVGYNAANQTAKQSISLKSLVYFLTDTKDDHPFTAALREHYSSLPSQNEKLAFERDLRSMLLRFFKDIFEKALAVSQEKKFDIRSITLCIPNLWSTLNTTIQEYLGAILVETISGRDIEVTFTFEAAARAQYLVQYHPEKLKDHNYLVVLDFGGHALGGSHGVLRWPSDDASSDSPAFYSPLNSDTGKRGGYEIWELEVGRLIDQQMTKDYSARARFPAKYRNFLRKAFLDQFFENKAEITFDEETENTLQKTTYRLQVNLQNKRNEPEYKAISIDLKKKYVYIDIPMHALRDAWRDGYREILDVAKKCIELHAKKRDLGRVFVLLSGGSIANPEAKNELTVLCDTWGRLRSHGTTMEQITLVLMKDIMMDGWKSTVAKGAAIALANTKNVEQFWDEGGVLCIQSSTPKGNFTAHTSGSAELLFRKDKNFGYEHLPVNIVLKEDKIIRLIADPYFHDAENKPGRPKKNPATNCYDVWDLTREYEPRAGARPLIQIPDGSYVIEVFSMKHDERDAVLTLQLRRGPSAPKCRGKVSKKTEKVESLREDRVLYFEVPLMSNGEANIVVLDCDRIKGRFWMPRKDEKAMGSID
ncbi:hypothetical protein Daus18300_000116 [Diaporthe australafricana]|uniref:Uncharacterized protein n=1 Tax=Diaporthe australafricana TaxID=127596 RepID=A0ABR3Y8B1_9PEZI